MRVRRLIIMLLALTMAARIGAQLPAYLSLDASCGFVFSEQSLSFEQDLIFGTRIDARLDPYIEGGNWLGYDEDWSDEVSLGAGISVFDWLTLSLHSVIAILPELDLYLRPALAFSWDFDDAGLTLSDNNGCAVHILTGDFEYENALDCDISFDVARNAFLVLGLSSDFAWAEEISEAVEARIGLEAGVWSVTLDYRLGLVPAVDHGLGVGISCYFD